MKWIEMNNLNNKRLNSTEIKFNKLYYLKIFFILNESLKPIYR